MLTSASRLGLQVGAERHSTRLPHARAPTWMHTYRSVQTGLQHGPRLLEGPHSGAIQDLCPGGHGGGVLVYGTEVYAGQREMQGSSSLSHRFQKVQDVPPESKVSIDHGGYRRLLSYCVDKTVGLDLRPRGAEQGRF